MFQMTQKSRSKNTTPELLVRKQLHAWGYRYRIHFKKLPGTPDIVFPKEKFAVFVNGCFWHQHGNCPIRKGADRLSVERREKFIVSQKRDIKVLSDLADKGWETLILWECGISADTKKECSKIVTTLETARRKKIQKN